MSIPWCKIPTSRPGVSAEYPSIPTITITHFSILPAFLPECLACPHPSLPQEKPRTYMMAVSMCADLNKSYCHINQSICSLLNRASDLDGGCGVKNNLFSQMIDHPHFCSRISAEPKPNPSQFFSQPHSNLTVPAPLRRPQTFLSINISYRYLLSLSID